MAALGMFGPQSTVRFALSGVFATPRTVMIPVRLIGTDALGHVYSQLVTVHAEPTWTLQQVHDQVALFAANAVATYGVQVHDWEFHPGVQLEPQLSGPQNATNLPGPLNTLLP